MVKVLGSNKFITWGVHWIPRQRHWLWMSCSSYPVRLGCVDETWGYHKGGIYRSQRQEVWRGILSNLGSQTLPPEGLYVWIKVQNNCHFISMYISIQFLITQKSTFNMLLSQGWKNLTNRIWLLPLHTLFRGYLPTVFVHDSMPCYCTYWDVNGPHCVLISIDAKEWNISFLTLLTACLIWSLFLMSGIIQW